MENIKPTNLPGPRGNFTGSTLVVDPATGFLTPRESQETGKQENGRGMLNAQGYANGPFSVFGSNKKLEFLEFLKIHFPNYSKCSKLCGITRATFKNHYELDRKFKQCVDEIVDSHVDGIEDVRFAIAKGSKGALDRMAILNAYRRERYNPDVKVQVTHEMTREETERRYVSLNRVIDAQIVDKVKEQKKLRDSHE